MRRFHHKISPTSLTDDVVCDPPTELPTIIGVQPVSIDILEVEIIQCWHISQKITLPEFSLYFYTDDVVGVL